MERFFNKISKASTSNPNPNPNDAPTTTSIPSFVPSPNPPDLNSLLHLNLPHDPGLRKNINEYDVREKEYVMRYYLQKGPSKPSKEYVYPFTVISGQRRKFNDKWFIEYSDWLEYSESKDAAYCLCCYLFKGFGEKGGDTFVSKGFRNWKEKKRLSNHVGSYGSSHRKNLDKCCDLMKQPQHIEFAFSKHTDQEKIDYRIRLTASIRTIRFLLHQGLAFRGHDESEGSSNQGNFLELLKFLAENNEDVNRVALKNAPMNLKLTAPSIQLEIINSISVEITNSIFFEIGDQPFSLLVDESRDISVKEQMAIVLRFVDDRGCIMERFVGLVHVTNTNALSLKKAIDDFFCKHGLSFSKLRGQGYDGASNMKGEFKGLKALILEENESAFYIHCFAHQLQLTLVAVAEDHSKVSTFFDNVTNLSNIVGASCKRRDVFREKQYERILQGIADGSILTGRGLNQETSLKRAGDTRWGSHYYTLTINLTDDLN